MKRLAFAALAAVCAFAQNPETAKYPGQVVTIDDLPPVTDLTVCALAAGINTADPVTMTLDTGCAAKLKEKMYVSVGTARANYEIMQICTISGETATTCSGKRGLGGTAARSHTSGEQVAAAIPAKLLNQIVAEQIAIQAALGASLGNVTKRTAGSGAPSNPCATSGALYVDTTAKALYFCPADAGTWALLLGGGDPTVAGSIRLYPPNDSTNFTGFEAAATMASNYLLIPPNARPGTGPWMVQYATPDGSGKMTGTFVAPPSGTTIASQAEAEAGTENTKMMTPLRVAQAIDAQAAGALTWTASATSGWHYPFGYGGSSAAIAALSGKLNWHRFTPAMNLVFTKVYSEYASAGYTAIAITNSDGSAAVTNGTCRTNAGAGGACVFPGTVTLTAGTTYIFATTSDANGGLRMGDTGASWVEYSAGNYKTFGTMAHTATGSGATLAVTIPFTPGGDTTSPKVPVIGFGN